MTNQGFASSPELRQINAAIKAQEREVAAARRSYFLPEVSLGAELTGFENEGTGSDPVPGLNNSEWLIAATATLPLFQGGERAARLSRANIELNGLGFRKEATRQRVEQRIRSELQNANASFIGISLAQKAAEAAKRNLEVVTDKYREGVVGILTLLDAQNQALLADLTSADTVFNYFIDLMSVQRSVGRFDYYRSIEERQIFLDQMDEFYRSKGAEARRP